MSMAGGSFTLLLVLATLMGRGPTDLLQVIPTKAYWEAEGVAVTAEAMLAELKEPAEAGDVSALIKDLSASRFKLREAAHQKILSMGPGVVPQLKPLLKSDDPEVAARAREIIGKLSMKQDRGDVRRLMAIRTLGEMKSTEALGALKKLTQSKELFVADYARRAVAAIEGRDYASPPLSAEQRMKDVWLLPEGCGLVAQFSTLPGAGTFDLQKAVGKMGPIGGKMTPQQIVKKMVEQMLPVVYKIGNVRMESVTMGVAGDVGSKTGYVVVIARGLYDAEKAKAALKEEMGPKRLRTRKIGQVEMYCPEESVALVFVANDCLVLIAGPRQPVMPLEAMAEAITSGRGTLDRNKELAALIEAADKSGPLWATAKMTEAYRKEAPILAPFTSASFVAKGRKDGVHLALSAKGDDAEKVKASLAELDKGLKEATAEVTKMAEALPVAKVMLEFLQGVKAAQEPGGAKITATLKTDASSGMMMAPFLLFNVGSGGPRAAPVVVREGAAPKPRRVTTRKATTQPAKTPPPEKPGG